MAQLYQQPTENNQQYTLDAQLVAGGSSLTLNQTVDTVVQAPGVCVIDRVDTSGNKTSSKREYITFTGVSGAVLSGLSRGQGGSTDQVHSVGAIVEFVPDVVWANAMYDVFTTEHTDRGTHASLPSTTYLKTKDLVTTNSINASGASLLGFPVRPVFNVRAIASSASTSILSVAMPTSGTFDHFNVSLPLGQAVSGASLLIDINKNGTSIFEAGTRPTILGAGTFASTASILTKAFSAGDIVSIDVDNVGNQIDLTVVGNAR